MEFNYKNTFEQKTNSKSYNILYLIILIAIVYLIYKFIYSVNKNESFESPILNNPLLKTNLNNLNTSSSSINTNMIANSISQSNLSPEVIQELKQTRKEFDIAKEKILNRIKEHDQAVFISNNYNKVNPDSFDQDNEFMNLYFNNDYPKIDLSKYKVIDNQSELNDLAIQISKFKNIYVPGEIVDSPSSFNINKNQICYQHKGALLNSDPNFMANYPECMVCSVNSPDNYKNMPSWDNTKTNIKEVCLFNSNPEPNSGIPNLQDCKKFCRITE